MLINLSSSTILAEQSAEDTLATHPQNLAVPEISLLCSQKSIVGVVSSSTTSPLVHLKICPDIPWHSGILGTLPLTKTAMTTNAASSVQLTRAGARVHGDRLADDEAIGEEFTDGLTRVGVRDL